MIHQDKRQLDLLNWINQQPEFDCQSLEKVSGDASFRRYFRFLHLGRSIIAVDAPPEQEDSRRFVALAKRYRHHQVPVPEVLSFDTEAGFYCLEDLGDSQFADCLTEQNAPALYWQALSCLPSIQACQSSEDGPLPDYDLALLDRDFSLFKHWLLEVHLKLRLTATEQLTIDSSFAFIQDAFFSQPRVGVHRDYHSRNLMLDSDKRVRVIDFQDAALGPLTYDLVSLLRDCYQSWPDSLVTDLLQRFHQQYHHNISWSVFKRWFDLTGMQRHIKASGIFARLWQRDGKASYLADIPRTLDYLIKVGTDYPQTHDFARLVEYKVKPAVLAWQH